MDLRRSTEELDLRTSATRHKPTRLTWRTTRSAAIATMHSSLCSACDLGYAGYVGYAQIGGRGARRWGLANDDMAIYCTCALCVDMEFIKIEFENGHAPARPPPNLFRQHGVTAVTGVTRHFVDR